MRPQSIGVVVSEMTRESATVTASVIANSRNTRPTSPPIKRIGMNTAISALLIARTVKPTSCAPCSAACMRGMPASTCRVMFSMTTIASSTTKPVATVSAIKERLFRLKPRTYITPNVPMSDSGTATAGTSAARGLRSITTTTVTTRSIAMSNVTSTSCRELRMLCVRSFVTMRLIPAGIEARTCGITALMPLTVSMTLAPGCLRMIMRTAR